MFGVHPCLPLTINNQEENTCKGYCYCSLCQEIVNVKEVEIFITERDSVRRYNKGPRMKVLRCLKHSIQGFDYGSDLTTLTFLDHGSSTQAKDLYRKLIKEAKIMSYQDKLILTIFILSLCLIITSLCTIPFGIGASINQGWLIPVAIGIISITLFIVGCILSYVLGKGVQKWLCYARDYKMHCQEKQLYDFKKDNYKMVTSYPLTCASFLK